MDDSGMTLTILGSGTGVPSLKRSPCSLLVETESSTVLFDIGAGTLRRLLENKTRIQDISHLFLSHFHPDHSGELISFLFALKLSGSSRGEQPLTLVGGKGCADFYQGLRRVFGQGVELDETRIRLVELRNDGPDQLDFQGMTVRSVPVVHKTESLAYRVEAKGRSLVYSGDTDVCEGLVMLADKADVFVCESAMPDEMKCDGHLTPSLAGKMAERANVKALVLTHFYPECDKTDIAKQCRKTYDGTLILAEDLMKIRV